MNRSALAVPLCLALTVITTAALGADVNRGKRLAEQRCESCHIIGPGPRGEVAEAPPFEAIGRKFGFDADMLVFALTGPHAKMNFSLSRPEADDVAAYVATLAK
jgi:cytochrome c